MRFVLGAACALACGATLVGAQPAVAADNWSTPADLSLPGQNAIAPQVAAGPDGTAFAIWARTDANGDLRAETARYDGTGWTTVEQLSAAGADAEYPDVVADGQGRAIAIWKNDDGVNRTIQARIFDGTSWQAAEDLGAASPAGNTPVIAMNASGAAVAIWSVTSGPNLLIRTSRYTPAGGWSTPANLSSTGTAGLPDVAINASGKAIVAWKDASSSTVKATTYDGTSWSAPETPSFAIASIDNPRVAINGSDATTVIWNQLAASGPSRDIIVGSTFDGTNWSAPTPLTTSTDDNATNGRIVIDRFGVATVLWLDDYDGGLVDGQVESGRFNGLSSAGPNSEVSASGGAAAGAQITLDADDLPVAVWQRFNGTTTVIQTKRYGGANWPVTATDLSDDAQNATDPQIAIGPDGIETVAWARSDGTNTIIQATRWPAPSAPTGVTATSLPGARVRVTFTPGSMPNALATESTATCTSSDGGATRSASGATSPLVVADLSVMKTYTCTVTTTSDASAGPASSATGAFLSGYILAVTSLTGSGTVTDDTGQMNCTVACAATQVDGSTVVLTATPAAGWSFGGWSGSCEGSPGTTCSLSMSQGRDVRVTFTQNADPPGPNPGTVSVPGAPSEVVAAAGLRSAAISWTAPASDGGSAITSYTATATPGGATCTSTTTRCTIGGLLNTAAYTVTVTATNAVGTGSASAASTTVRPYAKLKMKKPRGSGGRLISRVRVTGAATITQTGATKAGKPACRKTARAKRKGSVAVSCTLGRATRSALKKRAQTLTVTTTVLTTKGATLQATHTVRVKKTR